MLISPCNFSLRPLLKYTVVVVFPVICALYGLSKELTDTGHKSSACRTSLRKHPFLLALRCWGCFERTYATQWQKFHTDDANQCLHNKSGSHGVPNTNLYNFTCLLVDFGKCLCSPANELQQNSNTSSREDYIPQILTVLLEIHRVYIWPLWPFVFCLSFVNNS